MDNEERFALADRITELEGKLAEALLSAERAREEWMAKCEELRKDAALTALSGLVHAYVGLCRDSGIDPGMNTQYRNARGILAANKEPK